MLIVLVVVIRLHQKKRRNKNSGKVKNQEGGITLQSKKSLGETSNDNSSSSKPGDSASCTVAYSGKKSKKDIFSVEEHSKNGLTKNGNVTEPGKDSPRVSLPTHSNSSAVSYRTSGETPDGPQLKKHQEASKNNAARTRRPPPPPNTVESTKNKLNTDGNKASPSVSGARAETTRGSGQTDKQSSSNGPNSFKSVSSSRTSKGTSSSSSGSRVQSGTAKQTRQSLNNGSSSTEASSRVAKAAPLAPGVRTESGKRTGEPSSNGIRANSQVSSTQSVPAPRRLAPVRPPDGSRPSRVTQSLKERPFH